MFYETFHDIAPRETQSSPDSPKGPSGLPKCSNEVVSSRSKSSCHVSAFRPSAGPMTNSPANGATVGSSVCLWRLPILYPTDSETGCIRRDWMLRSTGRPSQAFRLAWRTKGLSQIIWQIRDSIFLSHRASGPQMHHVRSQNRWKEQLAGFLLSQHSFSAKGVLAAFWPLKE